jgi:hypothetical protein
MTLAQLVADRRIILPVSAGHFLETGRHRGPNRLPLACTLLELCGGWQMRHPGVVGASELVATVNREPSADHTGVFTLEPNSTFLRPFPPPAPRYPEPLGSILSNVIAVTATYDTVIDPSALIDEGAEARRRWAHAQDALVELFSKDALSRDQVHRAALARLLVDYGAQELQNEKRVGLQAIQSWLPRAAEDVAGMPYLGRLWRVMFARLRNGSPWSENDLVDIHNLSAAAGYADVAAGEKRTIADLRVAKPVARGPAWPRASRRRSPQSKRRSPIGVSPRRDRPHDLEPDRAPCNERAPGWNVRTFWQVAEATQGPLVVTHSAAAALVTHHRNLDDDQLQAISKCAGLVGLAFVSGSLHDRARARVSDAADHLDHIRSVAGPAAVAIGTISAARVRRSAASDRLVPSTSSALSSSAAAGHAAIAAHCAQRTHDGSWE